MSNVVDFDADDNAVDAVETQQAPPPPVVNPTEVAREVARILHNGQREIADAPVTNQPTPASAWPTALEYVSDSCGVRPRAPWGSLSGIE